MNIELIIDYRESKLLNLLNEKKLLDSKNIKKSNLDIGDIIFTIKDKGVIIHKIIIERKEINDLVSSIKDKRYKEQKSRIISFIQQQNQYETVLIYLIEGFVSKIRNPRDIKIYNGSIISMLLRDGIKLLYTEDIEDTCSILCRLYDRIKKKPAEFINIPLLNKKKSNNIISQLDNINNNNSKKKDNTKIGDNSKIDDNLRINENTNMSDNLKINENTNMDDNSKINENTNIDDNSKINEYTNIDDNTKMDDNTIINDNRKTININNNKKPIESRIISNKKINENELSDKNIKTIDITFKGGENLENYVKKKKSDNITTKNCGILMLTYLPGISNNIAFELLLHYNNKISELILYVTSKDIDKTDKIKTLSYLKINTLTGKKRNLGPSIARTLLNYLS